MYVVSCGGGVFAAAEAAGDATPMASAERGVAPQARDDERKERQADPPFCTLVVR